MKKPSMLGGLVLAAIVAVKVFCLPVTASAETGANDEEIQLEDHLRNLESVDESVRYHSVRALGELGGEGSVEALSTVVRNDLIPEIRGWALISLHTIGTPEAIAVIRVAQASDPDRNVRALAGELLSSTEPSRRSTAPVEAVSSHQIERSERSFFSLSPADQELYVRRARNRAISGLALAGIGLIPIVAGSALMLSDDEQNLSLGIALHFAGAGLWFGDTVLLTVSGFQSHRAMGRRHNWLAFICGVTMTTALAFTLAALVVGITTWNEEAAYALAAVNGVFGASTRVMSLVLGGQVMRSTRSLLDQY